MQKGGMKYVAKELSGLELMPWVTLLGIGN